jgi:hypothetical protein
VCRWQKKFPRSLRESLNGQKRAINGVENGPETDVYGAIRWETAEKATPHMGSGAYETIGCMVSSESKRTWRGVLTVFALLFYKLSYHRFGILAFFVKYLFRYEFSNLCKQDANALLDAIGAHIPKDYPLSRAC